MENEKTNRKILMMSFVGSALLAHIVTRVLFETLGGMFSIIERFRSIEMLKHGLPLAAALVTFLALWMNPKVVAWADEVVVEVRKIVWPSQKETTVTTVAVCVMVVVAGLGLAMVDYFSSIVINWIVN
jgi:preprotein translocase subunit SecE